MITNFIKKRFKKILQDIDVEINGNRPSDIQVKNDKFYRDVLFKGSIGFGEGYINNLWCVQDLEGLMYKIIKSDIRNKPEVKIFKILKTISLLISNAQTKEHAKKVGDVHYDIGNKLYELMLDRNLIYTCGYWKNANNLDEAQENKLKLIFGKLGLKPGMKVLDIGCGWGTAPLYAAKNYQVSVVGITISKKQEKYGKKITEGHDVEIKNQDYRDIKGKFDRIYSIGMFEHVGYKNYREYMRKNYELLNPNGLALLHTITSNSTKVSIDPWIEKYIFPNSMLPSAKQILEASEGYFILEDVQNFGYDYHRTLREWYKNFDSNWEKIKKIGYNERFYKLWVYYLLFCSAMFKCRDISVHQFVFSKCKEIEARYDSPR